MRTQVVEIGRWMRSRRPASFYVMEPADEVETVTVVMQERRRSDGRTQWLIPPRSDLTSWEHDEVLGVGHALIGVRRPVHA